MINPRPNHRHYGHACRRGVTLIEALMVIMILAASATIGAFRVSGDHGVDRETRAASGQINELLHTARLLAISKHADVSVIRRFEPTRRVGSQTILAHWVLDLVQQPSPYPTLSGQTGTVVAPVETHIDLSPEVRISGSPQQIQFRSGGNANRAAQWRVISRHADRRGSTDQIVSLDPITGLANTQPAS